jgi:hypothetical protein
VGETQSTKRPVVPNSSGLSASGEGHPAYRTPAAPPKYSTEPAVAVARTASNGDSNPYATLLASGTSNPSVQNVYATAVSRTAGMTMPTGTPPEAAAPARTWLAFVAVALSAVAGFVFWKFVLMP